MPSPTINEANIRSHATEQSFQRGESYCRQGAVTSLIQRGNTLIGKVEGSEYEPYRISVQFDAAGLTDATCTCPYSFEGPYLWRQLCGQRGLWRRRWRLPNSA